MCDTHKFPIGTQFMTRGKHPRKMTVLDQYTTTNAQGEVVRREYLCAHTLMGQVIQSLECETTVAMGAPHNA